MKLTPKQKKFAENVAIKKMTQSDAYRDAYDTKTTREETIHTNASIVMSDTKVSQRVRILEDRLSEKLLYTPKQSFDKFTEIQKLALCPSGVDGKLDLSNAKDCEKEKAKLANLYAENNKSGATKILNVVPKIDKEELEEKIRKLVEEKK